MLIAPAEASAKWSTYKNVLKGVGPQAAKAGLMLQGIDFDKSLKLY